MEASAIPASVGLARTRIAIGASLLRIRSDEQLITLFRAGSDDAFRVIHDRYRSRLIAYARQMLGASGQDPEDAVQEIFMRAYYGLRADHRRLALRPWLYRIAHNRCVDDLRRPRLAAVSDADAEAPGLQDPVLKVEQRDALRRLIDDVRRLPAHQRSALLMRELSGMSYAEVAGVLGVTVPAVKSLLVRARVGLAQASEARNTACEAIRADLILAHDRGVRTSGLARRHLRDCAHCREFRTEVRGLSRHLAALSPTLGPLGLIANLLGWGGGSGAAAGGGAVAATGTAGTGAAAGGGAAAGLMAGSAGHVVSLLAAAAVVTAGGAVEIQSTLNTSSHHRAQVRHLAVRSTASGAAASSAFAVTDTPPGQPAPASGSPLSPSRGGSPPAGGSAAAAHTGSAPPTAPPGNSAQTVPITQVLDPDLYRPPNLPPGSSTPGATGTGGGTPTSTPPNPSTAGGGGGSGTAGTTGTGTGSAPGGSTAPGSTPGSTPASGATGSTPSATGSGARPGPA
ncbi:MAG: RNA polymerase sigma factor, partial [Actinomycetota bacterium]|nr:RNA polymerase sigma factor [Actinomycetota bacterium]